jgi:hypothetical protein
MSAIAKPFIHFSNSLTPNVYVPVEHVQAVESLDVPAINNTAAEYLIVITSVYPNGATKEIKVPFATANARNTSLTNFKAAMSTAVA